MSTPSAACAKHERRSKRCMGVLQGHARCGYSLSAPRELPPCAPVRQRVDGGRLEAPSRERRGRSEGDTRAARRCCQAEDCDGQRTDSVSAARRADSRGRSHQRRRCAPTRTREQPLQRPSPAVPGRVKQLSTFPKRLARAAHDAPRTRQGAHLAYPCNALARAPKRAACAAQDEGAAVISSPRQRALLPARRAPCFVDA